jgi:hypothetical protein
VYQSLGGLGEAKENVGWRGNWAIWIHGTGSDGLIYAVNDGVVHLINRRILGGFPGRVLVRAKSQDFEPSIPLIVNTICR